MSSFVTNDPYLAPYQSLIEQRHSYAQEKLRMMQGGQKRLSDNCNSYLYYGLHFQGDEWVLREWLPNATAVYFLCQENNWRKSPEYAFRKISDQDWELRLTKNQLQHTELYKLWVEWQGGAAQRLPSHVTRVVQDPYTKDFSAQVWQPTPYKWKHPTPAPTSHPLIYEAHIGMASEQQKVASFTEFRLFVLPRIARLGYNTLQLMAIQEHPYYGSFGYQVSNFFAVSSRYGTPEELKELIDEAHALGIRVILDVVHSHSVSNQAEGLSHLDGTDYLYFHSGERGQHQLWGSRCFDYGKPQVLNFLLSNCKYWLEEFHFDGFRFDGVTSMIYTHHGFGVDFLGYDLYYDGNQDVDALTYLCLANVLIHELRPDAITIAEEVSGMPGLTQPFENQGIGFDFRMQMGVPDYWIKLLKETPDSLWSVGDIFYELTNHRPEEKTITYCESHDQALVGDKTLFFRMIDREVYTSMSVFSQSLTVDWAIALHKIIRFATLATTSGGYLAFMGNEWGHPEWIDFPREGNGWSYQHARRQWSLVDDNSLKFKFLNEFDAALIHQFSQNHILDFPPEIVVQDVEKQVLIFQRGDFLCVLNFSAKNSYPDYGFTAPAGKYTYLLCSDDKPFGGNGRIDTETEHFTQYFAPKNYLKLYIPSQCALLLKRS